MEDILKIRDLNVSFQVYGGEVKAVRHLSLTLHKGEVYALVGESGCGKSTVAHTILKLNDEKTTQVNGQTLELDGIDILNISEEKMEQVREDKISMIFQDPITSLNPTMKIGKQIIETLYRRKKLDAVECKKEAIRLLELVQIPDAKVRYNQYPHQLSGGMKQRVMIAMALATKPDLLIADEPTTALDVTTQAQILEIISKIQKELNTTVLLITHDFGVVANIANRVGVMYAGELVEEGSAEDIFYHSTFPYTQSLMKCLPTSSKNKKLYNIQGEPPDLYAPPQGCAFAKRCEECMQLCVHETPPMSMLSKQHSVRCWKQDKDYLTQVRKK